MPTVLLTGANRGLGLELAKHYAAAGWHVIVANRTPLAPRDFASLGVDLTELHYDALDDATAADVALRLRGRPIDLIIMQAGIDRGADLPPEQLDAHEWEQVMLTNVYAPLRLAALLESNLRNGEGKTLVAISSIAGSSTYDGQRRFAWSASKAALNQIWRNLSIDWRDWGCTCLTIVSDQGDDRSAFSVGSAIAAANPELSGLALDTNGRTVAW